MQRRHLATGLVLATGLIPSLASAADHPAVGRWDITVIFSPDYKAANWLEIREEKGELRARHCAEVSSAYDIGKIETDGNKISFKSAEGESFRYAYVGTIKNDTISGTCTVIKGRNLGKEYPFIGLKFVPAVDASGTWKMKLGGDKAELVLTQAKKSITGKMTGLHAGEVAQASLKGTHLEINLKLGEKTGKLAGTIKGDALEGTFDAGDDKPSQFTARRERKWGEPIKLFNGKDLDGWKTMDPPGLEMDNKWAVIDGIMTSTAGGENIQTKQKFKDFKLHVEFRVPPRGNSGVYLRGRYEIQIHDSFGKEPSAHSCGALYSRIKPSVNAAKPAGEWQTYDVTLVGQYVTVVHNGKTIIDNQEIEGITGGAVDSNEHEPGPIYFQGDHSKIEFRNVTLAPAL